MSLTLSPEDIEAIAERTAVKIAARPALPVQLLTRAQAMEVLACESESALSATLRTLGVSSVIGGKYRCGDIANAVARRALSRRKPDSPIKKSL